MENTNRVRNIQRRRPCHRRLYLVFLCCIIFFTLSTIRLYVNSPLHRLIYEYLSGDYRKIAGEEEGEDVYHSREVFDLDYSDMEENFKIYVYPTSKDRDDRDTKYCTKGKYVSERYFIKNLRDSFFVTDDPDKAHLFFIPLSCHKLHQKVSTAKEYANVVENYMHRLISEYPHWKKTLGADHFFISCDDMDIQATETIPFLIKNSIRVMCSPSYESGFIPHKDVTLPSVMRSFKGSMERIYHENRTRLYHWLGGGSEKASADGRSFSNEVDIRRNESYLNAGRTDRVLFDAKFCICSSFESMRATGDCIMTAIQYHCVPVILADYYDLPFSDVLDWRKFSVIVREHQVHLLNDIMQAKSGQEYEILHQNLLMVKRHFHWNSPSMSLDTFHMVLYSLWLRRNTIRYV